VNGRRLKGLGVSPGIAIGEPLVQESQHASILRLTVESDRIESEIMRFHKAIALTAERIGENRQRARDQMGEEFAAIFEAHQLIATDSSLSDPVVKIIREERVNAEWALDQVVRQLAARLEATGDLYFSERKLDVLDVASQIMTALQGVELPNPRELTRPVILVADDLPPSRTVQLPFDKILGLALETGGPTSHTTIIARSIGIPAIVGAHGACQLARRSQMLALDAFEGKIVFNPDSAEVSEYQSRHREYQEQQSHLDHVRTRPTVTRDGFKVELLANIDLPVELDLALSWNVDGIGLYRSEFLYMKLSPALPSEEEHLRLYREMVEKLDGRPVTFRTFDLGGKKLAREVIGSQEANPVLGLRGIRLCLAKPEFFKTQLRALVRLTAEFAPGTVRVMLPLISCIEEVRVTKLLLRQVIEEVREKGHPVPEKMPIGAMVEVPASAIMARELADEVDFLSIGTNDLIQYSLAVDRANDQVANLFRSTNPAVLRLIHDVINAGEAAGIDVSMCGEMAADPLMVPMLLGLGLRKFSMSPQSAPIIRNLIRQLSYRESVHLAREALKMRTSRDIEEFFLERLAISLAKTKIRV
jgi:phosphotransferase system enzyme I (PtsI)